MSSVDIAVYRRPTAAEVGTLAESHGMEAAILRYHWMPERILGALAQSWRASQGQGSAIRRDRRFSPEDEAVTVEACYVLGSLARGERAAGVYQNASRVIFPGRGLAFVGISREERSKATRIGRAANSGDPDAIAARDRMHQHDLAVGSVLRKSLALVEEQPATGRYRLPPVDAALRAALQGESPAAISMVFPDMDVDLGASVGEPIARPIEEAAALPTPAVAHDFIPATEEYAAVSENPAVEAAPVPAAKPRRRNRLPSMEAIRIDYASGEPVTVLADHYGVTPSGVYLACKRLGLPAAERPEKAPRPPVAVHILETAPPKVSVPDLGIAPRRDQPLAISPRAAVADMEASGRLGLRNLALAVRLSQEAGIPRDDALAWMRSDIRAVTAARPSRTKDADAAADATFMELVFHCEGLRQ